MSPIDDELRAALHGRAQVLAPSPDPLAGIERRAKRIQRNRIGAAVAGSALAVSAIAVAVPGLQGATSSGRDRVPGYAASDQPTADPTAAYALDPESPWEYRGDPAVLENGNLETSAREWAAKHGEQTATSFVPLYGEVYEPAAESSIVYVASDGDRYWWGVVQSSHSGPEFVVDQELPDDALALPAALLGDETDRLLVVTSPEAMRLEYGPQGGPAYTAMAQPDEGIGVTALEGDVTVDTFRVTWPGTTSDEVAAEFPAPDPITAEDPQEDPAGDPSSAAALDPTAPWEVRGDRSLVTDGQLQALGQDWAERRGEDASTVQVTPLYVQRYEPSAMVEVVYLVRSGAGPWTWGVSALGEGGWSWYAENELRPGTTALAAALPGDEGVERLLVVAAPSMGAALYAGDGSDFQPMTDRAPGVFLTAIEGDPAVDRYKVLDGDGDLDDPAAEGEVPAYQNAG